uniref:Integrator complex subunit 14 C-terminal domain-containing protein n=1 Tax=Ditylenchus dipsaci TaxID=166011 RepID=A0A915ERE2_9BILA
MNLYIALDCSLQMMLPTLHGTSKKFELAVDFVARLVNGLDPKEMNVSLIALTSQPRIVCEKATTVEHAISCFRVDSGLTDSALLNFSGLRDLILRRNNILNFELIVVLSAHHYFEISESFRMPCPVRFVTVALGRHNLCAKLLAELELVSCACANDAQINEEKASSWVMPAQVFDEASSKSVVEFLAVQKRTENRIKLNVSQSLSIDMYLSPGLPINPFLILENEMLVKQLDGSQKTSNELQLLGFVKAVNLLYLPSTYMLHVVRPQVENKEFSPAMKWAKGMANDKNFQAFHLFAEAMGSEGQVAVLLHSSREQCILKPLREEITEPWMLCLQFIPTGYYQWELTRNVTEKTRAMFAEEKGVSYKVNNSRTYWTDSHGIQQDIQKIHRLLKRNDRLEQFYQEIQRIGLYAVACGYDSFAPVMADMLTKRCANISPENKVILNEVVSALRQGGFKSIIAKER